MIKNKRIELKILSDDPLENLKKLMFVSSNTKDPEKIVDEFIEKAKDKKYFKNLYKKIKGKEFTWDNLKDIEDIGKINNEDNEDIMLKGLESFPLIYSSKNPKYTTYPNCVGTCQIITVLYSFDKNIEDLKFLDVYSSKKTKMLLKKLKLLNEISKESFYDLYVSDLDSFFKDLKISYQKKVLLDQILLLEDILHCAIKNKITNEIYDHKIERENYDKVLERNIKKGIFYSTLGNLIIIMISSGFCEKKIKEVFLEYYKDYKDDVSWNDIGLYLYRNNQKEARKFLNKIKEIYGNKENLPARFIITEIWLDLKYIKDKKIKEE